MADAVLWLDLAIRLVILVSLVVGGVAFLASARRLRLTARRREWLAGWRAARQNLEGGARVQIPHGITREDLYR